MRAASMACKRARARVVALRSQSLLEAQRHNRIRVGAWAAGEVIEHQ